MNWCKLEWINTTEAKCIHCNFKDIFRENQDLTKVFHTCTKPIPKIYRPLNFAKALFHYIKSGGKKVSKEQYEERLKICDECDHRNPENNRCKVCGCKTRSKIFDKAMLPKEKCPLGRWPPI